MAKQQPLVLNMAQSRESRCAFNGAAQNMLFRLFPFILSFLTFPSFHSKTIIIPIPPPLFAIIIPSFMEETQSFRLLGSMEVEEILCDQIDGQNIIYWEDIEHAFPGVQKVKNGKLIISMMRDSNRAR